MLARVRDTFRADESVLPLSCGFAATSFEQLVDGGLAGRGSADDPYEGVGGGAAALDAEHTITLDGHVHLIAGTQSDALAEPGGENESPAVV
jgi:hypothetical protein